MNRQMLIIIVFIAFLILIDYQILKTLKEDQANTENLKYSITSINKSIDILNQIINPK